MAVCFTHAAAPKENPCPCEHPQAWPSLRNCGKSRKHPKGRKGRHDEFGGRDRAAQHQACHDIEKRRRDPRKFTNEAPPEQVQSARRRRHGGHGERLGREQAWSEQGFSASNERKQKRRLHIEGVGVRRHALKPLTRDHEIEGLIRAGIGEEWEPNQDRADH